MEDDTSSHQSWNKSNANDKINHTDGGGAIASGGEYVKLITLQLEFAHNSNLLVFSRDKQSQHLAKKLKAEFGRVFFSSDVKECQKMIGSYNNERMEALKIDLVLTEYDAAAVKLIDSILRRPYSPETCNCPLLPVVIVVNNNNERDAKDHYLHQSGSIKFVKQAAPIKDLLLLMIDLLYGCCRVEDIFKDVKKSQLISNKYTYFPIFESAPIVSGSMEGKEEESVSSKTDTSILSQLHYQVDEVDEASECSHLLPDVVEKSPMMKAKRDNDLRNRSQLEQENEETLRRKEETEREEMRKWRENQLKKLEEKENLPKEEEKPDVKKERSFRIDYSVNLLGSEGARVDSVFLQNSDTEHSSENQHEDEFDGDRRKPRSEKLLDPKCRPKWINADSFAKHAEEEEFSKYDISSFITKAPPKIQRPLTVGGLDKKSADTCWKLIKNPQDETALRERHTSFFRRPMSVSSSFDLGNQQGRSTSFLLSPHSGKGSPSNLNGKPRRSSIVLSTNSIDENVQLTIERLKLNTAQFEPILTDENTGGRSPSRHYRRNNSIGAASTVLSSSSWDLNDNTKEEKKIAFLAKKNPPDYQVSNLLEIDFIHHKINLGEKDMLQRGVKLEKQGDIKAAISCYTNAGAHSKDQQISRMLLGNLHYRNGRLMTALKFYSVAIQIIELKPPHLQFPQDQFLAYYNRAIINFRLGADEDGLEDLTKAVKANPNDISVHELLSLAKRRVGKYNEAIDEAIVSETHRQEKKKQELLKAIEDAKRLQRIELGYNPDERNGGRKDSLAGNKIKLPGRKSSVAAHSQSLFNALMNPNARLTMRKISNSDGSQSSGRSSMRGGALAVNNGGAKTAEDPGISSNTAAIAHRREEYFRNLSPTKGLVIKITQPFCHASLRDKINDGKRGLKGDDSNLEDDNVGGGGHLKSFKIKNNLKAELFEEIFLKPNPLQEALLIDPNKRLPEQLNIVIDTLKQFPYTGKLSLSTMSELASVIEYRTIVTKDEEIFQQNDESGALVFLLKGDIEMRMDSSTPNNKRILGTLTDSYDGGGQAPSPPPARRRSLLFKKDGIKGDMSGLSEHLKNAINSAVNATTANNSHVSAASSVADAAMYEICIGEVPAFSVFGHIDLLFRHPRPAFKKAIETTLIQSVEHSKLWDQSPLNIVNNNSSILASNSLPSGAVTGMGSSHFPSIHQSNEEGLANDDGSASFTGETTEKKIDNEVFYRQVHDFMAHWNKYSNDLLNLNRSLCPGMFMNYKMQTSCELMMIGEKDFQRMMYDQAVEEFLNRLRGILASGVFEGWKPEDLVRLARMGQIMSFKSGDLIVKQGKKPSYLYIILKGMCKVMKKPNRTEMLLQKLATAEGKAQKHDLKYVFHHRVARGGLDLPDSGSSSGSPGSSRHSSPLDSSPTFSRSSLSPIGLEDNLKRSSILPALSTRKSVRKQRIMNAGFPNLEAMQDFSTAVLMPPTKPTEAEKIRNETEQEIGKLKTLIHKARILDAMEQKNAYQRRLTRIQRATTPTARTHLGLKRDDRTEDAKIQDLAYTLGNKYAEIRTIRWPMIFGEACILDQENGVSRGSIVADSLCEVFAIHKVQIQTFHVDDAFLERLKAKAIAYPADSEMVVNLYRQQEWKDYRKEVLKKVTSSTTLNKLNSKKDANGGSKNKDAASKHNTKK